MKWQCIHSPGIHIGVGSHPGKCTQYSKEFKSDGEMQGKEGVDRAGKGPGEVFSISFEENLQRWSTSGWAGTDLGIVGAAERPGGCNRAMEEKRVVVADGMWPGQGEPCGLSGTFQEVLWLLCGQEAAGVGKHLGNQLGGY